MIFASRSRNRRRASAILMFCAFAMPLLWAAAALSVDSMRIMEAQRRIGYATESAAIAGANRFSTNEDTPYQLDLDRAPVMADQAFDEYMSVAFGDTAARDRRITVTDVDIDVKERPGGPSDPRATVNPGHPDPARVTVTVTYRIEGLVFLSLVPGANPNLERTISRAAYVCVPEDNPYTVAGSCDRR